MLLNNEDVLTNIFYKDGSLRDIYILNTDKYDWNKFLNLLQSSQLNLNLLIDGTEKNDVNLHIDDVINISDEKNALIIIDLNGIKIHCHFFCIEEIELDINPKEIVNSYSANLVFEFMRNISSKLEKEVFISPENMSEYRLITIYPNGTYIIGQY
ncbi:hypothetical protein [Bacillus weihaiensis]|uniref:hypothetical protein n=1 Tax=Bacillus weihaiensis TaxID=1547283 RepID=UPI0023578558|nr:hypothetical protein [Bacillus weihaiensis]